MMIVRAEQIRLDQAGSVGQYVRAPAVEIIAREHNNPITHPHSDAFKL